MPALDPPERRQLRQVVERASGDVLRQMAMFVKGLPKCPECGITPVMLDAEVCEICIEKKEKIHA